VNPLPLGLGALLRALLPHEFGDDVVTELEERYADPRLTGRVGAALWLAREVAMTPFLGVRRQAWRLRARGVARGRDGPSGRMGRREGSPPD
jgi:hypothetical protein